MGVHDLVIYQKAYDAALALMPVLNRMPKCYRPTLARDLQAALLDIVTGIVAANQDPRNRAPPTPEKRLLWTVEHYSDGSVRVLDSAGAQAFTGTAV